MRIGLVTTYDAGDKRAFGGRCYYMTRELANQFDLQLLGPLSYRWHPRLARAWARDILQRRILNDNSFWPSRDVQVIKHFSRQVKHAIDKVPVDAVLSITSPGSQPVAYLDCNKPIVIWTDATFAGFLESFPEQKTRLSASTIRDGLANEEAALSRCSLAIYCSDWAAQTAIDYYDLDPQKVRVVREGANREVDFEFSDDQANALIFARGQAICRLFFAGEDFERKNGRFAIRVAEELNERGLETRLSLLTGDKLAGLPDFVDYYGFVDKSSITGLALWDRLLSTSHFSLNPSQADCSPLTISEAASFAVPSLASQVGGIQGVIIDGVNGCTFPFQSDVGTYVNYILNHFDDYQRYMTLAQSALRDYRTRLNWVSSVSQVKQYIAELVEEPAIRKLPSLSKVS